jgi:hypothetical protein
MTRVGSQRYKKKNIWHRAEVLLSGSRGTGPRFRLSFRCIIHLLPFTDAVWMKSSSVLFFYKISNKYNTHFLYKLRKAGEKVLLCTLTLPLN